MGFKPRKIYLGNYLCKRRRQLKLTQRELANQLGVKAITISAYETGRVDPPLSKVVRLARILSIDLNYLGWLIEKDAEEPFL